MTETCVFRSVIANWNKKAELISYREKPVFLLNTGSLVVSLSIDFIYANKK